MLVTTTTPKKNSWMLRACPVELHVCCYLAGNVNPPRGKPVASSLTTYRIGCSDQHKTPRDKPVVSKQSEIDAYVSVAPLDQMRVVHFRVVDVMTHSMAGHLRGREGCE
jgi:hypothetical protein